MGSLCVQNRGRQQSGEPQHGFVVCRVCLGYSFGGYSFIYFFVFVRCSIQHMKTRALIRGFTFLIPPFSIDPSGSQARRPFLHSTPYSVECYACARWGHIELRTWSRPSTWALAPIIVSNFVRSVLNTYPLFVLTCLFVCLGVESLPLPG